jgi:hypothetical protein
MEIEPYQCSFHHLTDARILQEVANSKPSKAIATRLYLVEDMTPIVVEILGSALSCSEFKPSTSMYLLLARIILVIILVTIYRVFVPKTAINKVSAF